MELQRLKRGSSLKLGRSSRSAFLSESMSWECARVAGYQRLSASMRMSNELGINTATGTKKSTALGSIVGKVLNFRKISGNLTTGQENKKKMSRSRWSSWLPDPDRRWPVQGW